MNIVKHKWNYVKLAIKNKIIQFGINGRADLVMWSGDKQGYKSWNWKDKNTLCQSHDPGITKAAVDFLIKKKCDIIILSKGYGDPTFKSPGMLKTSSDIKKYIKSKGIKVHNVKSESAVVLWNKLHAKYTVGMYLHSTC